MIKPCNWFWLSVNHWSKRQLFASHDAVLRKEAIASSFGMSFLHDFYPHRTSRILDLGTRWRWLTSLPVRFTNEGKTSYSLNMKLVGPQSRSGRCGKEKKPVLPRIEPRSPDGSARSLVTNLSRLCGSACSVLRLRIEKGLQIWRIAANILNKRSSTANRGWSFSLGGWMGLTIPRRIKGSSMLQNVTQGHWRAVVNTVMNFRVP
jgi:hypothetical protein